MTHLTFIYREMSWEEYQFRDVPLFNTHEDLEKKKGKFSMRRFNYLQALVTEFQDTNDEGITKEI